MRKFTLFVLLIVASIVSHATNYYNVSGSGTLQSTASWGVNADGTGANPGNFTTSGDVFYLINGSTGTISAAWVITGVTLNVGNGINAMNLTIPSGFSLSGTGVVNVLANATLTQQNTTNPTLGTLDVASTVNYNKVTGGQTVPGATYGNLILSNTSGTQTASGAITIAGTLTTTAGGTLSMSTNRLIASGSPTFTNNGTIQTSVLTTASTAPIPSGITWGGTVQYAPTTGAQTVVPGTYTNLTLSNTSGTNTAGGDIAVNGTLTTTSNGTFDLSTYTLGGTPVGVTNNGTITTSSTNNPALPSGYSWSGTTGNVTFALLTGGQYIPAGTYKTLKCSNTSGTNSAVGDLSITTSLITVANGTTDMGTHVLSGAFTPSNAGILNTQNTSSTPIPSGKTWAGTVNYNAATGGQTVVSETSYSTLTIGNTSGTNTAAANLAVTTLNTTAGGTLDMSTFAITSVTTITNNGTVQTECTTGTPFPTSKTWSGTGTLNYNVATGGQTLMLGTYNCGVVLSNTSGTDTVTGAITAKGAFGTTAGGTLDMKKFQLIGTTIVPANNGTINTQCVTSPAIPSGATWGGTVNFNAAAGAQSVPLGTYNNITFGNTSGTITAAGALTINGVLTTTAGGTLAMGTNQMLGTPTSVTNNGTITTSSTANPAIPSGETWAGTVTFGAASGAQFIPGGTYATLTCGNTSGTNTAMGNLTINTSFTATSGASGTLDMGTNDLGGTLTTLANTGTIKTQSVSNTPLPAGFAMPGTINYNAAAGGQTILAETSYNNLTLGNTSGTSNAAGNLIVNGVLTTTANGALNMTAAYTLGGTLTTITNNGVIQTAVPTATSATPLPSGKTWGGTGTVEYNAASGAQTIMAGTYTDNLKLSNTSGTNTASGNIVANGTLTTVSGGTLDMTAAYTLTGTLSTITNNGTIKTSVPTATSATPLASGKTWSGTGTVLYAATAGSQTVMAGTYNCQLTVANTSGTDAASGIITANSTLTTTAGGTLDFGTASYQLLGTITPVNNGTISTMCSVNPAIPSGATWNGSVIFTRTTGGQSIPLGTYNNLTLDNTSATNTAVGALTVNGAFTTTSGGTLAMGTNQLLGTLSTVTNNGTITTSCTINPAIPSGMNWTGTTGAVTFGLATGGQYIPQGTYKTLTCSNTSGTNTATGNLTVNSGMTTSGSGGTLDMTTYAIGGTLTTFTNTGTLLTQNTSASPLPHGLAIGGTVNYNAATGGQQIVPETSYTTLTISNTSGTDTNDSILSVTTLNTTAGGTLDMSTYALSAATTITNNGTIQTESISATPFPASKTWGGTGTINYNVATGGQTVVAGTYTNNLLFSNTSGTVTASGVLTVNGGFTTTFDGTLDMSTFAIAGTPASITNNGTIKTKSTTNPAIPSGKTWGGTVNYYATTGAQFVSSGTYNNLTLSNTSGSETASGALTVNGALSTTSGGTLAMGTNQLSGTPTVTNNGTITTSSTANPAIPSGQDWSGNTGTVSFTATAGGQYVPAGTYKTLTFANTSGTNTALGDLAVSTALTTSGVGGTLNMGANLLSGAFTPTNSGTIQTQNTSSAPIPSGDTWVGTVEYSGTDAQTMVTGTFTNITLSGTRTGAPTITLANGTINMSGSLSMTSTGIGSYNVAGNTFNYNKTTGGQTVGSLTYNNLTLSNTSGTNTAGGDVAVNGTLTTTSGGTFDMSTYTLGGTPSSVTNNGTIKTSSANNPAIPSGMTWSGTTGAVLFALTSGGQYIPAGTYKTLTLSNTSGTNNAAGSLTVNGTLTTTAGGTLDMGTANILSGTGTFTNGGIISTSVPTATSATPIPSGKAWGGTIVYNAAAGGQTIVSETSYSNLTLNNTSGTDTAAANTVVNAVLTTSGGILDMGGSTLSGTLSGIAGSGTIRTSNTAATPLKASQVWPQTIEYYNAAGGQKIVAGTYNGGLTNSNTSGNNTLAAAISVTGNLTLNAASSLADGGFTLTLSGNIAGTGTHSGTGKISMTGSGSTISGATLGSLTLNNAGGFNLTGSPVVNGTLTLTAGNLSLGTNNLTLGTAAAISGTPSSSNMIIANGGGALRKNFSGAGSFTYPVGDNTPVYSPVTLSISSGTFGGSSCAGVTVTNSRHPNNANVTNYLNRYWSIATSGITNPSYTTSATYAASDVVGTEGSISAGTYSGSLPWVKYGATNTSTHTLTTTAVTTTSADVTGISTAGPSVTSSTDTTICSGGSAVLSASGSGDPSISYTWAPSAGLSATTGAVVTATPTVTTVYTVTETDGNGFTATAQTTVSVTTPPTAAPANNGYICNGGTVTLTANPGGGTTTYAWSGANLSSSTDQNPTATPTVTTTYTLTVSTGSGGAGCSVDYTTTVIVNATPSAAPSSNGPICTGGTANLSANVSNGATSYTWVGSNLSSSTAQNPTANPASTTVYTLTVSDGSGQPGCAPATQYTTAVTVNGQPVVNISTSATGNICPAVVETLTATPSGGAGTANYTWSGPGISSTVSSGSVASYTVIPSPSYTTIPTNASGAYTVSLSYSGSGCIATTAVSGIVTPVVHQWAGGAAGDATNWNNDNNWICGVTPVVSDDILIPSTANQPAILASASGSVHSLYIGTSAVLTLNSSSTLNIKGNLTNKGAISSASTSQVMLNGSSAQTLKGYTTVYNMQLNNSAGASISTTSDTLLIKGTLTLTSGTLNTNNVLMLYSDASGTGRIGTITGGGISGNVIVQQYIMGGRRAYRFLGHSFSSAISLGQWENYIDITGPGGADNGFSTTSFNSPSAFWYHTEYSNSTLSADPGWMGITSLIDGADSNQLHQYEGIRVFVRGTKNEGLWGESYTPDPVTIRMWGTVNTGSQSVPMAKGSSANQDYSLLSNPYPSPVNLGAVAKRALDQSKINGSAFYVWNANMGSAGAFQAITIDGSDYFIEANASFEIRTTADGNTLDFTEADKSATYTTALMRSYPQFLTLNIYDTAYHPWDAVYFKFNDTYTDREDMLDAGKVTNPSGLSLYSISSNASNLAIDCRPFVSGKAIPMGITSTCTQDFIIKAENVHSGTAGNVYLHDKYLQKYLLLSEGVEYRFGINSDEASQGDNRFELLMGDERTQQNNGPVSVSNVQAATTGNIQVSLLPNPASTSITVMYQMEHAASTTISIVNMQGVEVLSQAAGNEASGQVGIDISNLPAGVYFVVVNSGNQKAVQRLIKE